MSKESDINHVKDIKAASQKGTILDTGSEKVLAIGQQRVHVNAITTKITEDIAFLQDRIQRMKQMKAPSQTVLATYEAMLASRLSVLKWLEDHDMITSEKQDSHQQTGS
ncbi:hypothetical protein P886_2136 [Alteromonadaceae bacterium 2753L.S.0a.02]|nr:hypothetical protein P886_2136 [Alteromonadaceae bacterium 2753L.S.0a.02]